MTTLSLLVQGLCSSNRMRQTHRDARESGSPPAVILSAVLCLLCKDILELLSPAVAVYHAASCNLLLYATVAINSFPPVVNTGVSHEYFFTRAFVIVLHEDKIRGAGVENIRVGGRGKVLSQGLQPKIKGKIFRGRMQISQISVVSLVLHIKQIEINLSKTLCGHYIVILLADSFTMLFMNTNGKAIKMLPNIMFI